MKTEKCETNLPKQIFHGRGAIVHDHLFLAGKQPFLEEDAGGSGCAVVLCVNVVGELRWQQFTLCVGRLRVIKAIMDKWLHTP